MSHPTPERSAQLSGKDLPDSSIKILDHNVPGNGKVVRGDPNVQGAHRHSLNG